VTEEPLSDWESELVVALLSIDVEGAESATALRESVPYLVVTERCECGCPSFFVRDQRRTAEEVGSFHYSNAWTRDHSVSFFLLVKDGSPWSVNVELAPDLDPASAEARPNPSDLVVESPYN
jgi:hypothetical protein